MNRRFAYVIVICLLLLSSCSRDTEVFGSKRSGIRATGIMTFYEYGEGMNAPPGIASGAWAYRTQNGEPVGEPVMVASNATLVDESVAGERTRVIRVNLSLRNARGEEVATEIAFFRPSFAANSYVVKTVLDGRYESIYTWGDTPGYSLADVTITELTSGEKVLETRDLEFIENSQGLFRGMEHHFSDGETVCISAFIRDSGTGLLVGEEVLQGSLPMDYHTYEFVLSGWPCGSGP